MPPIHRSLLSLPIWLATVACWSVPFLIAAHSYPIPTFYSEFATAICWVALTVGALGLTWNSKTGLPKVALAPLALIGMLIVQLVVATPLNPFFSFAAIVFLLGTMAVCSLGARCRDVPGVPEAIAVAVIVGGLLTVVIECLHLFRVPGLPTEWVSIMPIGAGRRMWGNLNQPNHVATYLAFGLAACLFLGSTRRRYWALLAAIALALLLGMALTVSRMSWLHLVLVGGIAGLAWSVEERGARRWIRACVPVLGLAVAYQLCNWLVAYANVLWHLDLPTSLDERLQQGVGLRVFLWKHAWHMFLAHPWLGGGWGDYAWNQYVQTDVLGHVEMSMNAHNLVLDLLAKVGVFGLLAVMLPFLGLVLAAWKRQMTPALAFLSAVILVTVAHSMLEYPLHYLYFLLPFAFVLGYVDDRTLRVPSPSMAWVLIAIVAVCGAVLTGRMWIDYRSVERLYYSPDGPMVELERYQRSGQLLLVPYANLSIANNAAMTVETAPIMAAIEHQAVQFYPSAGTVQRWAIALAFQGKTDEAITQVRRLHNQYWINYAGDSKLLTQVCIRKMERLATFCARLKAENLVVGAD
ncbi:PglL family O-oligosaccharyltransferase [Ralstonia solanacearum]|uniref:Polymerase n=1 Tax=Ralstonia solanacearum TaxID=305 RepID=A0AAD0S8Q4_RALSL|nr:Wzy polymerase domain-containing protein [Ralstonia solanacearum]AXV82515.1 polymerase [Ralstonia solanacearum]AXW53637.1 polymerase [Ralstonia solanacearum]